MRLDEAKDRSMQKYLDTCSKYCILVQVEARSAERIAITRSHAIVLYNTLPAICIGKSGMHEDEGGVVPQGRPITKVATCCTQANSQSGQLDQQEQGERTSCDHPSASQSSRETWCNNVDYRIPGIPHSAVQQQDTNRKETDKKLIQQFENHPNKESFLQDLNKTEESNDFCEMSQKLIADMNNTEIFELCETSSTKQCTDCALYRQNGTVYCSCGRSLKTSKGPNSSTRRTTTPYLFPVTSSKKNLMHGAKHGASERQRLFYWAWRCCRKLANQSMVVPKPSWKDGRHMRITESLCQILGGPRSTLSNTINLHWKTTPEIATPKERARNEKNWVLSLNDEGVQGPMSQRPEFSEAKKNSKDCMMNM